MSSVGRYFDCSFRIQCGKYILTGFEILGQCKHQTAMIFWLLRRSEEPSPTEICCYWKKSLLSTIKNVKTKTVDELSGCNTNIDNPSKELLQAFVEMGKTSNKNAGVIRYNVTNRDTLYMDHLMILFKDTKMAKNP